MWGTKKEEISRPKAKKAKKPQLNPLLRLEHLKEEGDRGGLRLMLRLGGWGERGRGKVSLSSYTGYLGKRGGADCALAGMEREKRGRINQHEIPIVEGLLWKKRGGRGFILGSRGRPWERERKGVFALAVGAVYSGIKGEKKKGKAGEGTFYGGTARGRRGEREGEKRLYCVYAGYPGLKEQNIGQPNWGEGGRNEKEGGGLVLLVGLGKGEMRV